MTYTRDNWLSETLNRSCWHLEAATQDTLDIEALPSLFAGAMTDKELRELGARFAWSRIATTSADNKTWLSAAKFEEIGVLTTYRMELGETWDIPEEINQYPPFDWQCLLVCVFGGANSSRWFRDPKLPNKKALEIVLRMATDQVNQPYFAHAQTPNAPDENDSHGFIGCSITADTARIGYMASVKPGTGTMLLRAAMTELGQRGIKYLEAGTYHWNERAHALYRKHNGQVVRTESVWHWHGG